MTDAMPPAQDAAPPPTSPRRLRVALPLPVAFALAGVLVMLLVFGVWGLWRTLVGSGPDAPARIRALEAQVEEQAQRATTLARSDQISREANRELQGALAEREEEVAGLRADVAFYERFVGATAQRRGLTVHELQLRPGQAGVWHFTATLTQSLNRDAVSEGGLTLVVEGTRDGRLEELTWTALRQHDAAAPLEYSFKYFQQVQGDLVLPTGFTPVRVTAHLAPARGTAVTQSFTWADATSRSTPGA